MYPKKLSLILLVGILAIGVVLSVGWYAASPQSRALAVSDSQSDTVQASTITNRVQASNQTDTKAKTVNGITVRVTSVKRIETGIEVGVCYATPDGGDWYPLPGNLSYSTYETRPDEFEFTSEVKADGKKMGERCVLIRYRVEEPSNISTPIKFSLTGLSAIPRELPPCEDLQQRLSTSPKAQAYGLKARCSYDAQGGLSVTLIEKTSSVTQAQAQQALDEMVKGEINGPWEFLITQIDQ